MLSFGESPSCMMMSVLFSVGCPYRSLNDVLETRLADRTDRLHLLDYLMTELEAVRMNTANKTSETPAPVTTISPVSDSLPQYQYVSDSLSLCHVSTVKLYHNVTLRVSVITTVTLSFSHSITQSQCRCQYHSVTVSFYECHTVTLSVYVCVCQLTYI